jgi:hypothetical protein
MLGVRYPCFGRFWCCSVACLTVLVLLPPLFCICMLLSRSNNGRPCYIFLLPAFIGGGKELHTALALSNAATT